MIKFRKIALLAILWALVAIGFSFQRVYALDYTILENGNWFFNYESQLDESYYSSLEGLKGQEFTDKLSEIITTNAKKITYGGGSGQTGDMLRYTDESPRNNNNVLLFYSGNDLGKDKLNQSSSWTWNQEHTWAKSHGFSAKSYNAYSDLHHLRPTYEYINSARSNYDFGEVEDYGGTVVTANLYGSKVINNLVFEPRDAVKGDVARIMMYMDVRYAGASASDPILTLNNKTKTGQSDGTGEFGNLQTLLKWHNEDPVDDMEKRRNDRIFEIQKNRNPFIDHPEYIYHVYGVPYTGEGGSIPVPDPDYDQNRANTAIEAINNIGTVTINSGPLIDAANLAYGALTTTQKSLVTNYEVLLEAISVYNHLLGNITLDTPYEGVFINATDVPSSYTANTSAIVNGLKWLLSSGCLFPLNSTTKEFRFGSNSSSARVPDKFGGFSTYTNGSSLEMGWNINNASKITFTLNGSYRTINEMIIVYTNDQGVTYHEAARVNGYQATFEAYVTPSPQTRFALLIFGSKPCVIISKVTIEVSTKTDILVAAINDLEINLSSETANSIKNINTQYEALTSAEQALVTNYNIFIEKQNSFNNLVNQKASEVDLAIIDAYSTLCNSPFAEAAINNTEDFYEMYFALIPAVIQNIQNKETYSLLGQLYGEIVDFLDIVYNVEILNYELNSINAYLDFYSNTTIKDLIDSDEYYSSFTLNIIKIQATMEFKMSIPKTSLKFSYYEDTNTIIENSLQIRFSMVITKELYDKLLAADANIEFGIIINGYEVLLNPVCVMQEGDKDENPEGMLYQFALVIEEVPFDMIDAKLTASFFVKSERSYYETQQINRSVADVAWAYIQSGLVEILPYIDILETLI